MEITLSKLIAALYNVDSDFTENLLSGIDTSIVIDTLNKLKEDNPNNNIYMDFNVLMIESLNNTIKNVMESDAFAPESFKLGIDYMPISIVAHDENFINFAVMIDEKHKETFPQDYLQVLLYDFYTNFSIEIEFDNVQECFAT